MFYSLRFLRINLVNSPKISYINFNGIERPFIILKYLFLLHNMYHWYPVFIHHHPFTKAKFIVIFPPNISNDQIQYTDLTLTALMAEVKNQQFVCGDIYMNANICYHVIAIWNSSFIIIWGTYMTVYGNWKISSWWMSLYLCWIAPCWLCMHLTILHFFNNMWRELIFHRIHHIFMTLFLKMEENFLLSFIPANTWTRSLSMEPNRFPVNSNQMYIVHDRMAPLEAISLRSLMLLFLRIM